MVGDIFSRSIQEWEISIVGTRERVNSTAVEAFNGRPESERHRSLCVVMWPL